MEEQVDLKKLNKDEVIAFAGKNNIEIDPSLKVGELREFVEAEMLDREILEEERLEKIEKEQESLNDIKPEKTLAEKAGPNGRVLLNFTGSNVAFYVGGYCFGRVGGNWKAKPLRAVDLEDAEAILDAYPDLFEVLEVDSE